MILKLKRFIDERHEHKAKDYETRSGSTRLPYTEAFLFYALFSTLSLAKSSKAVCQFSPQRA